MGFKAWISFAILIWTEFPVERPWVGSAFYAVDDFFNKCIFVKKDKAAGSRCEGDWPVLADGFEVRLGGEVRVG